MIFPVNFNKFYTTPLSPKNGQPLGFRGVPGKIVFLNPPSKNDVFEKQNTKAAERPPEKPPERGRILSEGKIFCRQSTLLFRDDINWRDFSKYLKNRFQNENRVNTYCYGCSRGDEAYSLSIMFQHLLKDEAEKFFPIVAKDINRNVIERNILKQKTGKKTMVGYYSTKFTLGMKPKEVEEYVMPLGPLQCGETEAVFTKKTTSPVIFECANILDDVENIDTTVPSLIMMRNMWPYIDHNEYEDFAKRLYNKLPAGSIVVIGEYDIRGEAGMKHSKEFPKYLKKAGFEPSKSYGHFLKKDTGIVFEKN